MCDSSKVSILLIIYELVIMKKILVSSLVFGLVAPLLVFAQDVAPTNPSISIGGGTTNPPVQVVYNPACASAAVIAHENTQMSIAEVRQVSMKSTATARRDALGAAYLLTDRTTREAAIKSAHDAFLTAQKAADKIAQDASKAENKSFRTTMFGCGAKLPPFTRDQMDNQNGPGNYGGKMMDLGKWGNDQGGQNNGNQNNQGEGKNGRGRMMNPLPPQGQPGSVNGDQDQQEGQQPQGQARPWWKLW